MNFVRPEAAPFILLAILVFSGVMLFFERRFFEFIRLHWFFRRSFLSVLSSALLLAGFAGLLIALLDLRGPEQKIKVPTPVQRTIILIDTSASMLAEDVKPSRLQKAALLAKHFARKAAGHQIAVVVFAEIQKKLVPFTTDLDLIDARLDSVKNLKNHYGSSALTLALQESVQYFVEHGGEARGNLIVLTDGEETADGVKLKIPPEIKVALVGIGTSQGGRIPLDDDRGFRFGYKKNRGDDVITKLDERFFKTTAADLKNAKYWIASSYSLPSEEILEFFSSDFQRGEAEQEMATRPVMMEYLVVPALLAITLAYVLKSVRIFTLGLLLVSFSGSVLASGEPKPDFGERLRLLERGRLDRPERLKLADDLFRAGHKEEALGLYGENLPLDKIDKSLPQEAYFNYGTALLEAEQPRAGLRVYDKLAESLDPARETDKQLAAAMEKNIATYFRQAEQKKEQKKKKDKQQKPKDGKGPKQPKSGGQEEAKPEQGDGEQGDPQEDDGDEQGDKDGDEKERPGKEGEKEGEKAPEPGAPQGQAPMPQQGLTPKLKQLLSDDRQLQLKMMEQGTRDLNKKRNRSSKDW